MSVEIAQQYFEMMDSPDVGTDEVLELYAEDPVIHSSRAGVVSGRDAIRQFYENNSEFFTGGVHHMTAFHEDGNVVVCEGYLDGETAVGRAADGVPLCDVMMFNDDDKIVSFHAYLDYQGYLDEVPDTVPNVRAEADGDVT